MSSRDLFLAIDVGTGSVRSALVDVHGKILAFEAKEHDQIVPRPGWLPVGLSSDPANGGRERSKPRAQF